MNYSKNYGTATKQEIPCANDCGKMRSPRGMTGLCKSCARKRGDTHPKKNGNQYTVRTDYEETHLWDKPEFKTYVQLVLGTFDSEWITLGEIHRRLGLLKNDRWTLEALRCIGTDYHLDHRHWTRPEWYKLGEKKVKKVEVIDEN